MKIRLLIAFFLMLNYVFGGDVSLRVAVNRSQIYYGESLEMSVEVRGSDSLEPNLSAIKNCDIVSRGSSKQSNYRRYYDMRGKVVSEGYISRTFSYLLTPRVRGDLTLGPITLDTKKGLLSDAGSVVHVTGIQKQDFVDISIHASRESVLVDEPFEITLAIDMLKIGGAYSGNDPIDPSNPPLLDIPYLGPVKGLKGPDFRKTLGGLLVQSQRGSGFRVNDYTIANDPLDLSSIFNMGSLSRKRYALFMFKKHDVVKNGKQFIEYEFKLKYTPTEETSHTFGPVTFKGPIVTYVSGNGRIRTTPIFAVGPAVTVNVVPPPEKDRPESYTGAIGTNLVVEGSLDTQTCSIGDPIKFTLSVAGDISFDNMMKPSLLAQPDVTRDFRVYEDSVDTVSKGKTRTYTYTLRPTTAGTIEFPPVKFSYYDTNERKYKTLQTLPLPLRVNEVSEVGNATVIDTVRNRNHVSSNIITSDSFIVAPIKVSGASKVVTNLKPCRWQIITVAVAPLIYLILLVCRYLLRRISRFAEWERTHFALSKSLSILAVAKRKSRGHSKERSELICKTVRKYFSAKFGVSDVGLTPGDINRILAEEKMDKDLIQACVEIMETHFNAGFSEQHGAEESIDKDIKQTRELLLAIEKYLRDKSKGRV